MANEGGGLGTSASLPAEVTYIPSNPPTGKCKVLNIYVDPDTGKLVIEYEDTPAP